MSDMTIVTPPEATDALFDTSDPAMARRFGARALELMHTGRDCREAARLAFSYAARVLAHQTVIASGPWRVQ